jgi:hypothetical protein
MIAGTLALLEEPADETLDSYHDGGYTALDVAGTQEYLDDAAVQSGKVAALVESTQEEIHLSGSDIDVERVETNERVVTDWVADTTDAGFVLAESTEPDDPPFPFNVFQGRCNTDVVPAHIDPAAFVERQERRDRDVSTWFSGARYETGENQANDVSMGYGRDANQAGGNIGVGFETPWRGTTVRGVLYASGYVAIYNPSAWGPMQFARFVREEIVPVASVPEPEDEGEQSELPDDTAKCKKCGRESDSVGDDGYCIVCQDKLEEEGTLDDLDTVNVTGDADD